MGQNVGRLGIVEMIERGESCLKVCPRSALLPNGQVEATETVMRNRLVEVVAETFLGANRQVKLTDRFFDPTYLEMNLTNRRQRLREADLVVKIATYSERLVGVVESLVVLSEFLLNLRPESASSNVS